MDKDKILNRLKAMQAKALTAAAYVLLAHILPFVPIDTGRLRETGKVVTDSAMDVSIRFGSPETADYLNYQYQTAQYHNFKNGAMARMLELLTGDEKASVSGEVNKDRYAAAYQQAMDAGKLTRFPNGARWFEIVMKDQEVLHRAWTTYANALRAA
jgi:hypothetical protein